jgi:hypothetical protein
MYKAKYIKLKNNSFIQIGGDNLNKYIDVLNNYFQDLENNPNEKEEIIDKIVKYIENNNIPLNYTDFDNLKSQINYDNFKKLYENRKIIYELDETNYNENLEWIINMLEINNLSDFNKLFSSNILGNNKNYVIYYMILLKYLIKNKKTITPNSLVFLSKVSLKLALNPELNSDEYLPIIINLINNYIFSFPIKKIINFQKPVKDLSMTIDNYYDIKMIDFKNKIIEYYNGHLKNTKDINYNDLQQIIYTIFQIPVKLNN